MIRPRISSRTTCHPSVFIPGLRSWAIPSSAPAARVNLWGAPPETKYTFRCPKAFARDLLNALIRDSFDLASSSALRGWEWGLAHAHINPLVFWTRKGRFPLLPLFVNCYGEEAGPDYPPRPTPLRCYELGRGHPPLPRHTRPERVAVVASSSWSHSFLAHKFQCCAIDLDTDRRYLELLRCRSGQPWRR